MLNKEKLEKGKQNHTSQKGITLIALIITIIVMLILVGVTINVALNGGLFDKAKDAAKDMEEQAMYEQIVMGMQLDGSKIDVEETFEKAEETFLKSGYEIDSEEGTNYILLTVKGKNGTYTYTITDEGIIRGEKIPAPPTPEDPPAPPTPEDPPTPEVDDDFIATTLMNLFSNQITEDVAVSQLKEHMSITDENIKSINDIFLYIILDTDYAYIYKIDRLYKLDASVGIIYAEEEQHSDQYTLGRNAKSVIKQIEDLLIGKTVDEIYQKYEDDSIESYIVDNSENITGADIIFSGNRLDEITSIRLGNTVIDIRIEARVNDEDGIYDGIDCYFGNLGT